MSGLNPPIAGKLIGTAEGYPDEAADRSRGNTHCDTQPRRGPKRTEKSETRASFLVVNEIQQAVLDAFANAD